jgi:hypothetical protein
MLLSERALIYLLGIRIHIAHGNNKLTVGNPYGGENWFRLDYILV